MIKVANGTGNTDGVAYRFLSMIQTDIPIVLVSRANDFVFNQELNSLKGKKYILCCFTEFGWQWDQTPHWWGRNSQKYDFLRTDEWEMFDDFIDKNPPALTFKRELVLSQVNEVTRPIEFPNWQDPIPLQSKEEYLNRPLSVFSFWGRSHEARVQLHGDIWKASSKRGYSVCDSLFYFNDFMREEKGEKWASFWIPHYGRTDISNIIAINGLSKLSVSMPGAGIKCFRSTGESPINSVMVMPIDWLAWSYPWKHEENCFKVFSNNHIETIEAALDYKHLYDVYLASVENANRYNAKSYIQNYLMPIINSI